jgi:hypothetical protein
MINKSNINAYGPGGSVGITTDYGLDGPGSNAGGGEILRPIQTGPGAHPASYTMGTGSFPGSKAAGAWRWLPTPSSPEVKERVQLYLYSPSGPPWPDVGWPLLLFMYAREHVKRREVQRFAVLFRHQGVRAHRPSDEHEAHVMSCHVWERTRRERHLDVSELTLLIAVSF